MKHLNVFLLIILTIPISCCKKGVEPKPPDNDVDTTSHNFTWVIDTLGVNTHIQPSYLWDVFVVNENDVWAVGALHTEETDIEDSTGYYVPPYSAAHWDGEKWGYIRFLWDLGGTEPFTLQPIYSIWVFSGNNIWIASTYIFHSSDGKNVTPCFKTNPNSLEGVTQLWAASENEIYGVGREGLIVRYDGNSWQRMPSGTNLDLWDVWGVVDEKTGKTKVWTVGLKQDQKYGVVLELKNGQWKPVFDAEHLIFGTADDHTVPVALWVYKDSLYISYSGYDDSRIYRHSVNDFTDFALLHIEPVGAIRSMNGIGYNDFFGAGHTDALFHYNGCSVTNYYNNLDMSKFYSVKQKGDYVFVCGENFYRDEAIVLRGIRNK